MTLIDHARRHTRQPTVRALITCLLVLWCRAGETAKADEKHQTMGQTTSQVPSIETVFVAGGEFVMGTKVRSKRDSEYHEDESPLKVTVQPFWIAKYPVTAEQMCMFLNSKDPQPNKNADLCVVAVGSTITTVDGSWVPRPHAGRAPANRITWKGAVLFCEWLSSATDKTYRLPSEAEWEFAARGKEGRAYPWSDQAMTMPLTRDIGERFDSYMDPPRTNAYEYCTVPIGSHPDNGTPEGIMDMCAYRMSEWCASKFYEELTPERALSTEMDATDLNTSRAFRGGQSRMGSTHGKMQGILRFFFYSRGPHGGCAWTRGRADPITAPRQNAYGFRVVEERRDRAESKP